MSTVLPVNHILPPRLQNLLNPLSPHFREVKHPSGIAPSMKYTKAQIHQQSKMDGWMDGCCWHVINCTMQLLPPQHSALAVQQKFCTASNTVETWVHTIPGPVALALCLGFGSKGREQGQAGISFQKHLAIGQRYTKPCSLGLSSQNRGECLVTFAGKVVNSQCLNLAVPISLLNKITCTGDTLPGCQKIVNSKKSL